MAVGDNWGGRLRKRLLGGGAAKVVVGRGAKCLVGEVTVAIRLSPLAFHLAADLVAENPAEAGDSPLGFACCSTRINYSEGWRCCRERERVRKENWLFVFVI